MNHFYTNVAMVGNKFLVRGYENGQPVAYKDEYQPTLFVKSNRPTEYKTLNGEFVEPIQPGTVRDCREWYKKYEDVDNFTIYGYERYLYQYISDKYPENEIKFDMSKIKLVTIDIETQAEYGFPDPKVCAEEILLITVQDNVTKKIKTWGTRQYTPKQDNVEYIECAYEADLLNSFLDYWANNPPDVITGWNCIPEHSNIWTKDKITSLSKLSVGDVLYDSKVEFIYPKSNKVGVVQVLSNGAKITSSYDHRFPYVLCPSESYTNLKLGPKSKAYQMDMSVKESIKVEDEKFLFVQVRDNKNEDNHNYTLEQCYLLGLIYTDGSLKDKSNPRYGFRFYQSDKEFIENLKEDYKIANVISGPNKGCYSINIRFDALGNIDSIYNGNKKKVNVELLSTFSQRQFYMFLSGMLDGDGYVGGNTVSLCNYNDDIESIYELCLWNGIFSTIRENSIRFVDIDFNKLTLRKDKRWSRPKKLSLLPRNSSQKARLARFKKIDGGYLVRVVDTYEVDSMTMVDIKTDTNYFVYSGTRTHNCSYFDLPYIFGRVLRVLGESHVKLLSPWGLVSSEEVTVNNREQVKVNLVGISQLDYLELYKKFTYKAQESYRLDYIAEIELGQKKLDHSEFETFRDFYRGNWEKFVDYNVIDVELVDRLEDKMKLIELALTMAYDAKVNYEDVFYQVRMWDNIIYLYLKERNIVVPPKSRAQRTDKYAGAYVKEPVPGVYDWVVSLDVDSMYPHIIMQTNLGPDTIVEERCPNVSVEKILNQEVDLSPYKDYAVAPNGAMYRKDKRGILPELMLKMYNERLAYKKRMLAEQAHLEQIEEEMKIRGLL